MDIVELFPEAWRWGYFSLVATLCGQIATVGTQSVPVSVKNKSIPTPLSEQIPGSPTTQGWIMGANLKPVGYFLFFSA